MSPANILIEILIICYNSLILSCIILVEDTRFELVSPEGRLLSRELQYHYANLLIEEAKGIEPSRL